VPFALSSTGPVKISPSGTFSWHAQLMNFLPRMDNVRSVSLPITCTFSLPSNQSQIFCCWAWTLFQYPTGSFISGMHAWYTKSSNSVRLISASWACAWVGNRVSDHFNSPLAALSRNILVTGSLARLARTILCGSTLFSARVFSSAITLNITSNVSIASFTGSGTKPSWSSEAIL